MHEASHLFTAKLLGYNIEKITILPVGINGKIKENLCNKADNFIIAIAGPLVNLILALCTCGLNATYIPLCNIYMLILNLLPIPPLDGSRICSSFFENKLYDRLSKLIAYSVIVLTILFDYLNNGKINVMLIWITLFTLFSGTEHKTENKTVKPVLVKGDNRVYELLKEKQSVFIIYENEEFLGMLKYEDIYNAAINGLYYLKTKELITERTKNGYQRIR